MQAVRLKDTINTKAPLKIGRRGNTSPLEGAAIQDARIYKRELKQDEIKALSLAARLAWLLAKPGERWSDSDKEELYKGWLTYLDPKYWAASSAMGRLENEESEIRSRSSITHVMQEREEAAMAYVLFRGEYTQRKEIVTPATPEALPAMPASWPQNRLGFAKWLLLPEHPLTTRVTVNRFWQEVFRAGIVRTTGDFGVSG